MKIQITRSDHTIYTKFPNNQTRNNLDNFTKIIIKEEIKKTLNKINYYQLDGDV